MGLASRIQSVLKIDPDRIAVEFEARSLTWGDLGRLIEQIDSQLSDAGVGPGQPVGLLLRNRPEMVGAVLCMLSTRRCIVSLNPQQGGTKLHRDIVEVRVPALIAVEDDWSNPDLQKAAQKTGSFGLQLKTSGDGAVQRVPGLEQVSDEPHRTVNPDIAIEMLSSGTTGRPKRIPLSFEALEESIVGADHYESNRSETPSLQNSFALVSTPLVHIGGMFHMTKSAVDGRPICLLDRFRLDAWRAAVKKHRPKVTGLVPASMKMVLDAELPPEELSSLRAVTSGTAPLNPEIQERFESRFGIPVLITYGATEFAGAVAGWTLRDHREFGSAKRGSVGRAHPGCELRIVDPESGEVLSENQSGLLEVRSAQAPSRGWIRTTDEAHLDEDAFLWIEGRADGAINRGGFKIDPTSVAEALERHPSVREAAVIGLDDDRLGQIPAALIELKEGAGPIEESEILDFARENLTRYYVPVHLKIVDAIPRTPSLKPSQPDIRELFAQEPSK